MRNGRMVLLAVGLTAVVAGSAPAQQRVLVFRGGLRFSAQPENLVTYWGVQQELAMNAGQTARANAVAREMSDQHTRLFLSLRGFRDERASVEKGIEVHKKAAEETLEALADVLKSEQVVRLKQIHLQEMSVFAFLDPDVATALGMDDEQSARIRRIAAETVRQERDAYDNARGGNSERQEKGDRIRKESRAKAVAVLDDAQKKTWKKMIGDPVEIRVEGARVVLVHPGRVGGPRPDGPIDYTWSAGEMRKGLVPAAEEAARERALLAAAAMRAQQAQSVIGLAEWVAQSTSRSMGAFHIPSYTPPPVPVDLGPIYNGGHYIGIGDRNRVPPNQRVPPPRR
jgi:hypothetical protein